MGTIKSKLKRNKASKSKTTKNNDWVKNRGETGERVTVEVVCDNRDRTEKWYVAVKLKKFTGLNLMRKKIDSNHCNAVILSFVGRRHEICQLYQVLNHESRAYIFDV